MKKICNFVLIIFLLTFILALNCSAHSGKTDSSGGHYNHSTGEYHYHHGYPEHQHPNGVCPYSYNNNSNNNAVTSPETIANDTEPEETTGVQGTIDKYTYDFDTFTFETYSYETFYLDGKVYKIPQYSSGTNAKDTEEETETEPKDTKSESASSSDKKANKNNGSSSKTSSKANTSGSKKESPQQQRVKYDDLEHILVWSSLIGYFTVIMTSGIKFDLDEKTKIPFSRYGTEDHFALVLLTQIIHLFPAMMLGIPWYAVIIVFFTECFAGTFVFCIPEFALWISAFVVTIYGPQDAWAIVYYIFFAIYCIYFVFQLVKQIQNMARNKRSNR